MKTLNLILILVLFSSAATAVGQASALVPVVVEVLDENGQVVGGSMGTSKIDPGILASACCLQPEQVGFKHKNDIMLGIIEIAALSVSTVGGAGGLMDVCNKPRFIAALSNYVASLNAAFGNTKIQVAKSELSNNAKLCLSK